MFPIHGSSSLHPFLLHTASIPSSCIRSPFFRFTSTFRFPPRQALFPRRASQYCAFSSILFFLVLLSCRDDLSSTTGRPSMFGALETTELPSSCHLQTHKKRIRTFAGAAEDSIGHLSRLRGTARSEVTLLLRSLVLRWLFRVEPGYCLLDANHCAEHSYTLHRRFTRAYHSHLYFLSLLSCILCSGWLSI